MTSYSTCWVCNSEDSLYKEEEFYFCKNKFCDSNGPQDFAGKIRDYKAPALNSEEDALLQFVTGVLSDSQVFQVKKKEENTELQIDHYFFNDSIYRYVKK